MEHTTFHMEFASQQLEGALKRFAHLFINPLMKVERFEKEIHTIDLEFLRNKCNDSARLEQLIGHTSPKRHPFNRFAWGNKSSLSKLGPDFLRNKALELFNQHYVAQFMNLVVMGEDSLKVLEEWVAEFFRGIKRGNFCYPTRQLTSQIWNSDVMYILQSIENGQQLNITWLLPPLSEASLTNRPENYLVQLLSNESKGSLCSFFKDKGWISSFNVFVGSETSFKLSDECSYKCTSAGRFFTISLDITNDGLEEKYEIVKYVYQYLNLVRTSNPPEYVEKEYSASLRLKFQCLDIDDSFVEVPSMFVQRLAGNMLKCPPSHVLCLDFLHGFGGNKEIQEILKHFNPQNMRIDLLKPKPLAEEDEVFETEPYFNATFKNETIPPNFEATLEASKVVDSFLHFPERNEFMFSDFTIRNFDESDDEDEEEGESFDGEDEEEDESDVEEGESFEVVEEGSKTFIYKKQRGMSYAFLCIYVNVGDVIDYMKTKLFIEMINYELSAVISKGREACINTCVSFDDNKLELLFDGYREKLGDFVTTVWKTIRSFKATSSQRFEIVKETMAREFSASSLNLVGHAEQLLSEASEGFDMDDKLHAVENISFQDFSAFVTQLLSQVHMTGLFFGDLTKDESRKIFDSLEMATAGTVELARGLRGKKEIIPGCPVQIDAMAKIKVESNSLAKIYFQLSCKKEDFEKVTALVHVFKSIVEEKLFHHLRVQEGPSYDVGCDAHSLSGSKGFYMYVVSPQHPPEYLLQRMYKFIEETFKNILAAVDESDFEDYRSGVLGSLRDESGKALWDLIVDDIEMKGYYSRVGDFVRGMTKEDLIEFYDKFFGVEKSRRDTQRLAD